MAVMKRIPMGEKSKVLSVKEKSDLATQKDVESPINRMANRVRATLADIVDKIKGDTIMAREGENFKFKSESPMTQIVVDYDVGFGNSLCIRGQGGGLSWDLGLMMRNESANRWVWMTHSLDDLTFKVLINDRRWEEGDNHTIAGGESEEITPQF